MAITRMAFGANTDWRDVLGFIVRIGLSFRTSDRKLVIEKGSIIYGFRRGESTPYGYIVDVAEELSFPNIPTTCYLVMHPNGTFLLVEGNRPGITSISRNLSFLGEDTNYNFPWYGINLQGQKYALIGKVFQYNGVITGIISVDDGYWAEYEGENQ